MPEQSPYVITISRQLGSGGSYLGKRIAARLGIHYADREIVHKAAEMFDVKEEVVEPIDENTTPTWQSLLRSFVNGIPEFSYMPSANIPPLDTDFHLAESAIITQIAVNQSSVIVGRGGYHLLRGNPNHLAVFLYADNDFRSKRIQNLYRVSAEDAESIIETSDHNRKQYLKTITGSNWTDARQYHLSINISALGFILAENVIVNSLHALIERNGHN